jgi:hypothetical protein
MAWVLCPDPVTEKTRRYYLNRLRQRANRAAHSLIPPLRLMKTRSGSSGDLHSAAKRSARDHLLRVRSSTLSGSDLHKMVAAKASGFLTDWWPRMCRPEGTRVSRYRLGHSETEPQRATFSAQCVRRGFSVLSDTVPELC